MEVQFPAVIYYLLNIGILIFVLQKFLYKPIRSVLSQRAEKIETGLKAAEANLKKQASSEAEAEAKLKEAQKEATQVIKDAKKQAADESLQVIAQAKETAKQAMSKERQAFESMMETEKAKLTKAFAQSVIQASEQLLRSNLSDADIKKVTDKQISNLKGVKFI